MGKREYVIIAMLDEKKHTCYNVQVCEREHARLSKNSFPIWIDIPEDKAGQLEEAIKLILSLNSIASIEQFLESMHYTLPETFPSFRGSFAGICQCDTCGCFYKTNTHSIGENKNCLPGETQ